MDLGYFISKFKSVDCVCLTTFPSLYFEFRLPMNGCGAAASLQYKVVLFCLQQGSLKPLGGLSCAFRQSAMGVVLD